MTCGMRQAPKSDYYYCSRVIIGVDGALVGRVARMDIHPNGDCIWLAFVDVNDGKPPAQIVYGGERRLKLGDLVPVAPPGARCTVLDPVSSAIRTKRIRARNYRTQRSTGMLCSLDELGWLQGGPNEVAVFCELEPGYPLDTLLEERRPEVVPDWERAVLVAKMAQKNTSGPMVNRNQE